MNALRGEPNVQGACDMGVLNNYMPGYLNYPVHSEPTLAAWTENNGTARRKYLINTLKAFYGRPPHPKTTSAMAGCQTKRKKDFSSFGIFESALAGKMKMVWIVGQNPAVTTPNLKVLFDGMAKLEMLVVQELWETETAAFWRRPGVDPKSIATEVLLLPAAFFMEKGGTISNSGGMVQWRYPGVKPPGQALPDGLIVDRVFRRVRDLVHDSNDPKDDPIRKAFWTYTTPEDVLREINGRAVRDIPDTELKADTSSARRATCGRTDRRQPGAGSTPAFSAAAKTFRSGATRGPIRAVLAFIPILAGLGQTT